MGIEVREGDIAGAINATNNPRPGKSLSQFFLNGASQAMNVNGSVTPVTFQVVPATGKKLFIFNISTVIEDPSINFKKFAGISGGLTNGVVIKVKEGGEAERTISIIKVNRDFYLLTSNVVLESAANDLLVAQADLDQLVGTTWELSDTRGDYIKITIQDNLSSIILFNALARGYEVSE